MKKLIAIICAVAVVATSLFGALVFTAAAEDVAVADISGLSTVTMSTFGDAVFNVDEAPPSSVATLKNMNDGAVSVVKNTSNLPFSNLFKVQGKFAATSASITLDFDDMAAGDGALFYVENNTSHSFCPIIYLYADDGSKFCAFYTAYPWFRLGEDDIEWTETRLSSSGYATPLPANFKGYLFIPFDGRTYYKYGETGVSPAGKTFSKVEFEFSKNSSSSYGNYLGTSESAVISAPAMVTQLDYGKVPYLAGAAVNGNGYSWFEEKGDTVVIPALYDEFGNEANLFASAKHVPNSMVDHPNVSVVENSSKLPYQSLYSIYASKVDDAAKMMFEAQPYDRSKGLLLYVEIPNNETRTDILDNGTADVADDKTFSTDKYRLAFTMNGYYNKVDATTGAVTKTVVGFDDYTYGGGWYSMAVGTNTWKSESKLAYGIALDHGFKGYVYIPFASYAIKEDKLAAAQTEGYEAFVDCVRLRGLSNAECFLYDGRQYYGYTDAEHQLVLSVPAIVTHTVGTTNRPSTEYVIIDGQKYTYKDGLVTDYSAKSYPAWVSAIKVSATGNTTVNLGESGPYPTMGTRQHIQSTSLLTDRLATSNTGHRIYCSVKQADKSNPVVLYENGSSSAQAAGITRFETPVTRNKISGYIFHITIPATQITEEGYEWIYDTRQKIQLNFLNPNGTARSLDRAANPSGSWYSLEDGDASWTEHGPDSFKKIDAEGNPTDAVDPYSLVVGDGTEEWSGYVYVPVAYSNNYDGAINTIKEIRVGISSYRHSNYRDTCYPSSGLTEPVEISAVSVTSSFTKTTFAYGDNGRLVDLVTGEVFEADYYSPKKLNGNEDLLPDVTGVVRMNTMSFRGNDPFIGDPIDPILFNGGTIKDGATYVKNPSPVSNMPLFSVEGDIIDVSTSQGIQFTVSDSKADDPNIVDCDEIDGFMYYVKNGATEAPIHLGAAVMISSDGVSYTTKYSIYNDQTIYLLEKGSNEWTTAKAGDWSSSKIIPANFEGWVYSPKFSTLKNEHTMVWRFNIYMATTKEEKHVDLEFGSFMTVEAGTWSTDHPDLAIVNEAKLPQNLWTGEFTVPNDFDGNYEVNLKDLVNAKLDNVDAFQAFRDSYLDNYFAIANDKKDVFKYFSLKSFSGEDTELFTNPERGYRTEMPIYIKAGAPDPLYYYPTYPKYESDKEWVNGVYFETRAEAQAWIDAEVAKKSKVNLIYYQNTQTLVQTATMNAADTFVIDAKEYTEGPNAGKTLYYVYRAFENQKDANAFCAGEFNLVGDSAYVTRAVDIGGKSYYTVRYDDRSVFTGMTEAEQKARFEYVYRIYFNKGSNLDRPAIALLYIYLSDWNGATAANPNGITEELPADALQSVRYLFDVYRGHSVKAEARFSYNGQVSRSWKQADVTGGSGNQIYNDDWLANNCANQNTILKHIDQLAPVITEYKDAIFNISCGFIGYVGEMADSYQYPHVDYATVQKAIVEKLCVPNNLYFSTRDPSYKEMIRESFPNWEYFDRIATNCDSFYGEQTKEGWHSGNFQKGNPANLSVDWWEYVTANAAYTPQGGEMYTIQSLVTNNTLVSGLEAILQLAHHRYTTFSNWHGYYDGLSHSYNLMAAWKEQEITPAILDANGIAYDPAWFKDGVKRNAYDFIRDHLGYRLVAKTATIDWTGKEGSNIDVSISLKNYGFAAAFNLESGIVILDANGNVVREIKAGESSTWYNLAPNYYTVNRNSSAIEDVLTHRIDVSFDGYLENGKYRVGFYLKNNAGKYARLANDVEFVNGYNIVGDFVVVDKNHSHNFAPANCVAPQTCKCGETKGVPTGVHTYYNKECSVCKTPIDVTGTLGNVMIMGDSISTYHGYTYGQYGVLGQAWYGKEQDNTDLTGVHQTWWNILMSNMDATLAYNRSCSGSTIAEATWVDGVQTKRYNSFNARLDEVLSHDELQMFGYTPADINTFIFFGGTNDNNRANIGEAKYSDWTAEDLKYFAPAYCRYIATVKANFPNAKIVSLVDTTLKQVADTQIAINEHYGITTVTINGFDEVAPHPTVKGMRQIEETLRIALSE